MATPRRNFTESEIEAVWKKAKIQANNNPDVFRKDYAGAWIRKSDYGKHTKYGWEVDHVKPLVKGGSNELDNLLPLHWRNNSKKGDNYPQWDTELTSEGIENIEINKSWYI